MFSLVYLRLDVFVYRDTAIVFIALGRTIGPKYHLTFRVLSTSSPMVKNSLTT